MIGLVSLNYTPPLQMVFSSYGQVDVRRRALTDTGSSLQ